MGTGKIPLPASQPSEGKGETGRRMLARTGLGWVMSPGTKHLISVRLQWSEVAFLSPCDCREPDGKDTRLEAGKRGLQLNGALPAVTWSKLAGLSGPQFQHL